MTKVKILDKEFEKNIAFEDIQAAIQRIADRISDDYRDSHPMFLCVLNGAFMFAADLFKYYQHPCEISFIQLSSYDGTDTTGKVETIIGLSHEIKDRDVIILEDIVDSGITVAHLVEDMKHYEPKSVRIATLLLKPDAVQNDVRPDYVGIEIPNDFIVGFGLDYNGYGRNFKDIYRIVE